MNENIMPQMATQRYFDGSEEEYTGTIESTMKDLDERGVQYEVRNGVIHGIEDARSSVFVEHRSDGSQWRVRQPWTHFKGPQDEAHGERAEFKYKPVCIKEADIKLLD